jgi:hypothetical protein
VRDLRLALIGEAVQAGAQGGEIGVPGALRPGLGEEEFGEPIDGRYMPEAPSRDLDFELFRKPARRDDDIPPSPKPRVNGLDRRCASRTGEDGSVGAEPPQLCGLTVTSCHGAPRIRRFVKAQHER